MELHEIIDNMHSMDVQTFSTKFYVRVKRILKNASIKITRELSEMLISLVKLSNLSKDINAIDVEELYTSQN